jgi:hypothetical protein
VRLDGSPGPGVVHYLPIATTLLSALFFVVLISAWRLRRSGPHLLWWAVGILTYGLGTALESAITLFGNTELLNRSWYVAGAILGGYPLAQGAVWLLCKRKTALILSIITLPLIATVSVLVFLSPVDLTVLEPHRPTGAILEWRWVRLMTPLINLYAAAFLIGGAIVSAFRFARNPETAYRAKGNMLIAMGAILPGIGGAMAKAGFVEALYVGEFVGLILIWGGYNLIARHAHMEPSRVASGATS